jgi:hypothetical protein
MAHIRQAAEPRRPVLQLSRAPLDPVLQSVGRRLGRPLAQALKPDTTAWAPGATRDAASIM